MINTAANIIAANVSGSKPGGTVKAVVSGGPDKNGAYTLRLDGGREATVRVDGSVELKPGTRVLVSLTEGKIIIAEGRQRAPAQQPPAAVLISVNITMDAGKISEGFESPLMKSIPAEVLERVVSERGGIDAEVLDTLTKIDSLLKGRSLAVDPASRNQVERIEQWLRVALDNPKLIGELAERIPLAGAKDAGELLDKLAKLLTANGSASIGAGIDKNALSIIADTDIPNSNIPISNVIAGHGDAAGNNQAAAGKPEWIEALCKAVFNTTQTTLLNLVRQIDSSPPNATVGSAKMPAEEARKLVSDVAAKLPAQTSVNPEMLHDAKQLSPQAAVDDTAAPRQPSPAPTQRPPSPEQTPQPVRAAEVVPQIKAVYQTLTESAIRILIGGDDRAGQDAAANIRDKLEIMRALVDKIHAGTEKTGTAATDNKTATADNKTTGVDNTAAAVGKTVSAENQPTAVNKPTATTTAAADISAIKNTAATLIDNLRAVVDAVIGKMARTGGDSVEGGKYVPNRYITNSNIPISNIPNSNIVDTNVFMKSDVSVNTNNSLLSGNNVNTNNSLLSGNNVNTNNSLLSGNNVNTNNSLLSGNNVNTNNSLLSGNNVNTNNSLLSGNNVNTNNSLLSGNNVNTNNSLLSGNNVNTNNSLLSGNNVNTNNSLLSGNNVTTNNMGERLQLLGMVRDTIASLDDALRPLAHEERPVPQKFYERVINDADGRRRAALGARAAVFAQIGAAQSAVRELLSAGASAVGASTSASAGASAVGVSTSDQLARPVLLAAQRIWVDTENLSAGFRDAFSSLDLQSRVASAGGTDGQAAATVRQGIDTLRTEILLEVSGALREIFSSIDDLRANVSRLSGGGAVNGNPAEGQNIVGGGGEAADKNTDGGKNVTASGNTAIAEGVADGENTARALTRIERALIRAVVDLERQAQLGSTEIMDRLKDVLKELSRLQSETSRPRQTAQPQASPQSQNAAADAPARPPSPADVIRSTALTAARSLENLALLSTQARGAETQQQVIALPVKVGQEWTEVQIKLIRERRGGEGKNGGGKNGHVSIYLNTAPSRLGEIDAHFDFNPPASLKLSIRFEKPEVTDWFRERSAVLKDALARAGLPGTAVTFHNRRAGKRAGDAVFAHTNIISDGKVDFKI